MNLPPLPSFSGSAPAVAAASPTTRIIDTHTGGEPTRLVVSGGPVLRGITMAERLQELRDFHDHWRRALVTEPRGSAVMVGALLTEAERPGSDAGVIFFNSAGYLGMCGHGSIGVVASLAHLGRIRPGPLRLDTPVGTIQAEFMLDGTVRIDNVPAYRLHHQVAVTVQGHTMHGDVAWGGNWFFVCADHGQTLTSDRVDALAAFTTQIRQALQAQDVRGAGGAEVDHIQLTGPALDPGNSGRNFVLCPGLSWDRSPCGTGTSAKLACLAAEGQLAPGSVWRQESVIGSVFEASYQHGEREGEVRPSLLGRAYVLLDGQFIAQPDDPFAWGWPAVSATPPSPD
ncbi:proline racemase family protein [Roseateles amylovorans]|uniref:Proline racemase family protein n=1 Tax=Roseateles amylovorans TaxID=2978473 RepID=A0ABY6B2N5_9BURK|nr:proline racemase family protein [Roseateles amylovorans]UXH78969.1 proline racemase family protein [Roseateles amylovorans]